MVIRTTKGLYEVIKNVRNAFDIDKFQTAYLEEYFDSYQYIVGDIASNTLRLKGFSINPGKKNYYKFIPDYLTESCAYRGAYFILRRLTLNEYNSLNEKYKKNPNPNITKGEEASYTVEKKPFDKENLVLESSPHRNPHIVFDMQRINEVKIFELPDDLKDDKMVVKDFKQVKKNKEEVKNNNIKPNNKEGKAFSNNTNKKAFSNNK